MGGIGSGSWSWHYIRKSTVESKNAVSIHYLKKQGCLHEGNNGTLSWSRNGEPNRAEQLVIVLKPTAYSSVIAVVVQIMMNGKM